MIIGIATGRGKSARLALQKCLPHQFWEQIIMGYYNCADIGLLSDNNKPDGTHQTIESLYQLSNNLKNSIELNEIAVQADRPYQITLEPKNVLYIPS